MEYPATQMFVNDDDDDLEEEKEEEEEDAGTPLRAEKKVKVGVLLVDSIAYPVHKGINKVGRINSCSIIIDHSTISKEHAEIEAGLGSKSTFISDLGSLNKTKINDVILRPRKGYQLQDGDVVRFGSVKTVFKVATKDCFLSRNADSEFVIPETPAPIAKEIAHPIIPGTPDLSFDRSLGDENRSSDVSLIAGTQEGGRSSPRLSREPNSSIRVSPRQRVNLDPGGDATSEMSGHRDISEMETQKNFSIPDSDEEEEEEEKEENIFDMVTQKSDVHEDETQKFSNDNVSAVMLSKYVVNKVEEHSRSIEDLETQKFAKDNDDGAIDDLATQKIPVHESRRSVGIIESNLLHCSINDLETQKFEVADLPPDSFRSGDKIEPRFESINDLETQKFDVEDAASGSRRVDDKAPPVSYSIHDVDTQKFDVFQKDDEDSETDEEGIFENSDESVDMFNAPTQVIRTPRESSGSPCQLLEREKIRDVAVGSGEEEITLRIIPERENIAEERGQTPKEVETDTEVKINDENTATLNDSIESKLNHMFDDVNETAVEEPTQMLTQNLENILETTQVGQSDHKQREEGENINSKISGVGNNDGDKIEDADDDDIANSDDGEREEPLKSTPKKQKAAVIKVPEILSTQELFAGLPAINIFRTPRRGRIKVSPSSDGIGTPESIRSEKSEACSSEVAGKQKIESNAGDESNSPKRAGLRRTVESVTPKRPKTSGVGRNAEKNKTPAKTNVRKKSRIQNEVNPTAGKIEKISPKAEEPRNESDGRKVLPLKKRGSSISSSPQTPQKNVAEVVVSTAARTGTRSSVKITGETGKRSSRLSAIGSPKVPKLNHEEAESPAKIEPASRNKKGARSKRLEETSSRADDAVSKTENPRKKMLEKSAGVSDEEVSPVKRPRMMGSAGLPPNVNDRQRPVKVQRGKRTAADHPESSNPGIIKDENLPTRSRRARLAGNNSSTNTSRDSLIVVEDFENTEHQPSLESQEIQAILGVADQRDNNATVAAAADRGVSRYRAGIKVRRNYEADISSDQENHRTSSRLQSAKNDTSKKDVKDEFEKPVGRPVRATRQSRRIEENAKELKTDDKESSKKPAAKTSRAKIADVVKKGNSPERASSSSDSSLFKGFPLKHQAPKRPNPRRPTASSDDEVTVEDSAPHPEATPKTKRAGKENAVDKIAPKRIRGRASGRGRRRYLGQSKPRIPNSAVSSEDEIELSQTSTNSSNSSRLRRGRSSVSTPKSSAAKSSTKIKHRILFTGLNDPGLISIVNNLGGTVTEKPNDCTALVTDKVRRTYKFLCGMAMAVPIVSIEWLKQSEKKCRFLDTGDFLLKDPVEEAKFKFDLRRSLAKASGDKLLDGYTIVLTPNTAPPPNAEMKGMIQACGGKALARPPTRWPEKSLIISRQEDLKNAKKFLTKAPKSVKILSVEFILTGILRHELNFDEHKLEVD